MSPENHGAIRVVHKLLVVDIVQFQDEEGNLVTLRDEKGNERPSIEIAESAKFKTGDLSDVTRAAEVVLANVESTRQQVEMNYLQSQQTPQEEQPEETPPKPQNPPRRGK